MCNKIDILGWAGNLLQFENEGNISMLWIQLNMSNQVAAIL